MPACCRDSISNTQDEQLCGALGEIGSCKKADQSSDESFAESNAYGDELDNLTEIYEFDGNVDEILTVGEEVLEIEDDEDVSTLTQSLTIESLDSTSEKFPKRVSHGRHMYSRVVTSFKKSMRLFISCVKPDAGKDSSEEAWRREDMMFVSSSNSQETLGPWREVSASQTEELQKEEIPLVGVEEGGEAKGKDAASLVAPAGNDSPITSVQQNDQTHTVHYFQKRFGRFILERHRQIRATLHGPLLPPVDAVDVGKKCLVLDLDETLIHSQFAAVESPDLEVPIELDSGVIKPIYVCKRPGVDEFLAAVGQHFEVVIFTASLASYADPVIDFLDKTKTIKHRLYRDSCVFIDGLYLKDLSRLGRPLEQITLIDNAPMSYMLQPQNGVAIVSWFADRNDEELLGRMLPALHALRLAPDVYSWKKTNSHLISE